MKVNIHSLNLGASNCYLIQGEGVIIIDCGPPKQAKRFIKALKKLSLKPEDIQLIIITHGHWDHIGSARDIKELTGAKIAMHRQEKDWLENSLKPLPPGVTTWGRILGGLMSLIMPLVHIPAANVDVVLEDEGLSLAEYGIPGRVIYTPGHSKGSVSVLLETGAVFVGDTAMNNLPVRLSPGLPIFAEDLPLVKESWKLLLDRGAKMVYPGHGKPFSVDFIQKALQPSIRN